MSLPDGFALQGPADARLGYHHHLIGRHALSAPLFRLGINPLIVGAFLAIVIVAAQVGYYLTTDYFDYLPADAPMSAYPIHIWYDLAHAGVMGYVIAGSEFIRRGFACNLRSLNENFALPMVPEHLMDVEWRGRLAVVLLIALPMVASVLVPLSQQGTHPAAQTLMYIRLPIMFAVLTISVYDLIRLTQKFARVIESKLTPDLLKPDALEPIARFSLRSAAFLAFGVALSAPMVLDGPTAIQTSVILGIILVAAVIVLMLPALAARRVIRKAKADGDLKIANRIEATVNELDSDVDGKLNQAALAGLFAWRQEVRQVREWVFGLETNLRFLALALVPVVSWVGGALTEGLIDRLMGN